MKKVLLSDFGILPDTDITLALYNLFREYSSDTEFIFENADYYFSPKEEMYADYRLSNSDIMPYRVLGIWLKEMKNCILRGNGARLFFEGQMQPFTLDRCENIELRGFTVNWKYPLVAEGTVKKVSGREAEVFINPEKFPHRYNNDNLEFYVGADEWYKMMPYTIAFEPHNYTVRRNTGDVIIEAITPIGDNLYRFTLDKEYSIRENDLLNLRHNARIHAGIFSEKCRDININDITFYSCGGLGCLAQFCHNVTYKRVNFLTDKSRGRFVSGGRDDGMHLTCNSGRLTVTECSFHALMDDPINVHGCCVTSNEVVNSKTLRCKYRHSQAKGFLYWAEVGDEIVFIERGSMSPIGKATACRYTLEDGENFLLEFSEDLDEKILSAARCGEVLALDNLTHTAEFICTKNRFGSGRARGVLVSTPKRVLIKGNYFESSGSAILVAGDANGWFESGECHDVEITDNIFTDRCLTSDYQFCEGIISVCPVVPEPDLKKPFHKNIRITNNTFDTACTPVLYGYSCENLEFSKNRILKSPAPKWHKGNAAIKLCYCKEVSVKENQWIGNFADFKKCVCETCNAVESDI